LAAEDMMTSKGFNPALLKVVALGDAPVRTQALRSGVVEAIAMNAPYHMTLMKSGFSVSPDPKTSSAPSRWRDWL